MLRYHITHHIVLSHHLILIDSKSYPPGNECIYIYKDIYIYIYPFFGWEEDNSIPLPKCLATIDMLPPRRVTLELPPGPFIDTGDLGMP